MFRFHFPKTRHYSRAYSTQNAKSKVFTKGMLKSLQKQDVYSLRAIIDPRVPGMNDKGVGNIFTPLIVILRRFFSLMKMKKDLGFFEEEAKLTNIKNDILEKVKKLYECTNINQEKNICTPSGYDALKNRIQEIIKTKKQFTNASYQFISIVNIAFANIPKTNTNFVQMTGCIQLPNGDMEYVVFERDVKNEVSTWKFAGWVDPSKVYRKASMGELLGSTKEQRV